MESTVISFLPYDPNPKFPGTLPGFYSITPVDIEALKKGDFTVTHIPDALDWVNNQNGQAVQRTLLGEQVAGSIVNDHIASSFAADANAFPGLKSLPGKHSKEDLKKNFKEELAGLLEAQTRWFVKLTKLADDVWNDPNARGKHAAISDLQRYAARIVKPNAPWLVDIRVDLISCPACTGSISDAALVCPLCKTIVKPKEYNAMFNQAEKVNAIS